MPPILLINLITNDTFYSFRVFPFHIRALSEQIPLYTKILLNTLAQHDLCAGYIQYTIYNVVVTTKFVLTMSEGILFFRHRTST